MKFGCVIFELSKQTDRQKNKCTHHNTLHPSLGQSKVIRTAFC